MGTLLRNNNNNTTTTTTTTTTTPNWHLGLLIVLVALVSAALLLAMPDPALAPAVRW